MKMTSDTSVSETVLANPEQGQILDKLQEQGIALIPEFIDKILLAQLNDEFDEIIINRRLLDFNVTERDEAITVAIVRNRLSLKDNPAISKTFTSSLMYDIARGFYQGAEFALNHQIYANLNHGTREPLRDLPFIPHLDKIHTLKFFVYLSDTTAENGAISVIPGSHHANRARRQGCLESDSDFRAVSNLVDGVTPQPIEASAGSLIVFETDVTHTAGHVKSGYERRVLRGHTRTVEEMQRLGLGKELEGIV